MARPKKETTETQDVIEEAAPEMSPTNPERDKTLNLYQRLNLAMRDVGYVQKEKLKVNNQYTFASHDAVTAAVREPFVKYGIYVQIDVVKHERDGNMTIVDVEGRFCNIDKTEEIMTLRSFGYGIDGQDKGPGKAISYAVKYLYLKALGLETGDDPERDSIPFKPEPKNGHSVASLPPSPKAAERAAQPTAPSPPTTPSAEDPAAERAKIMSECAAISKENSIPAVEVRRIAGKPSAELSLDELRAMPDKLREFAGAGEMAKLYQKINAIASEMKISPTDLSDFIAKECDGKKSLEDLKVYELGKLWRLMEAHKEVKSREASK